MKTHHIILIAVCKILIGIASAVQPSRGDRDKDLACYDARKALEEMIEELKGEPK